MSIIRAMALLSAAVLTMGSGGVAKAPEEPVTTLEPEYVDTEQTDAAASAADEAVPSELAGTDAGDGIEPAASAAPVTRPEVSPETSAAVPDDGAAIEVSLSDDYLQGRYYTGGGILGFDQAEGHVGVYLSDNRDIIGNIGLMTRPAELFKQTPLFREGLTLSLGARGYLALLSSPNDDVFGFAPGIEARYGLPFAHPTFVVGNIFYAPDVLTLGDAENIVDIDARFEAQIVPSVVGFVGYREFRFDSDEGSDVEAASEIQIGARFVL